MGDTRVAYKLLVKCVNFEACNSYCNFAHFNIILPQKKTEN